MLVGFNPQAVWQGKGWRDQAVAQTQSVAPLAANDVSWLFPAPRTAQDVAGLISIADVSAPGQPGSVWQDAIFQKFLGIADSPAAQVAGTATRIGLPAEARSIAAWKIAAIRFDAGAPGLSQSIQTQFGQAPQIRIILQPVILNANGTVQILDIAAHLIFSVAQLPPAAPAQPGCFPLFQANVPALKSIVADLATIRGKLAQGQLGGANILTTGVPLGVHPGLKNVATAGPLRDEMKAFLQRHIAAADLGAMAIMALPANAPAPWIFLSMLDVPQVGFVPVHGPALDGQQFAEMLNKVGTLPRVLPAPHNNNLAPITCQHAALPTPLPVAGRNGAATADLLTTSSPASAAATQPVVDLIADPGKSHFFNTDCVSCHTETRLRMDNMAVRTIAGIDPGALPNGPWNVRNFGWGLPANPTVSERTATETASVVQFINTNLLAQP
jgi:hypothetical protein